jgi:methyl acetate hydrolase
VVGMAATGDRILYAGAFGTRDEPSGVEVSTSSIFALHSMTKPITSVAAMQLVERGKLQLNEPAGAYLPMLADLRVLEGFDATTRKPVFRPPARPVTLQHLLTHTSGFAYETWDEKMLEYDLQTGMSDSSLTTPTPLVFDPGTRWQYGTGLDWVGRIVESLCGTNLEKYFQADVLGPLGMVDTSYILPPEKMDRLVSFYQRAADGRLHQDPRVAPPARKTFSGGGGLFSTAPDYIRFAQMILNRGRSGRTQVLQPSTVDLMTSNQIGSMSAGRLKTLQPDQSSDVDFDPGFEDKFGFGFLIKTSAREYERTRGSLSWAGKKNTYFWIDPRRGVCAVLMMQYLPFFDKEAISLLSEFERTLYASLFDSRARSNIRLFCGTRGDQQSGA